MRSRGSRSNKGRNETEGRAPKNLKLCEFGRGANNCQRCSGRVPSLAAAAGKLAIIAGDEISTSNAPAELCISPTLWAHQSLGRPGRRTFRFLPRIHSGWAISLKCVWGPRIAGYDAASARKAG